MHRMIVVTNLSILIGHRFAFVVGLRMAIRGDVNLLPVFNSWCSIRLARLYTVVIIGVGAQQEFDRPCSLPLHALRNALHKAVQVCALRRGNPLQLIMETICMSALNAIASVLTALLASIFSVPFTRERR